MKLKYYAGLLCALTITGCSPRVDEQLISYFGAPTDEFAVAQEAAEICGKTAFAWSLRETIFKNQGYTRPDNERLQMLAIEKDAVFLEKAGTGVIVQLGGEASLGGNSERGCIVGLAGMSPQQSYDLALPWAERFDAPTNAELGQGLARNAIEVWNLYGDGYIIRIAAYKTWDVLGQQGSAARLVTGGNY